MLWNIIAKPSARGHTGGHRGVIGAANSSCRLQTYTIDEESPSLKETPQV